MKKITAFLFFALMACTAFAGKPNLHQAINSQNPALVKIALDAGADPNEKSSGATEFCWACITGQTEIIKLLLEKGAKVDETGLLGMTALSGLINFPKTPGEIVAENQKTNAKILKHFTEENAKEKGWWLDTDSTKYSTVADRAKLLLDAGANPNFLLGNGTVKTGTPFLDAVEKHHLDIVKVMLDSKKVDTELRYNQWAERVDRFAKSIDVHKFSDSKLAKDWASVPQFNTPLIFAVEKQNLELVKLLVEGGADIDNGKKIEYSETKFGTTTHYWEYWSPLDVAVKSKKVSQEIVDYLISKGATRNMK